MATEEADRRIVRRSRLAGFGVMAVFVAVGLFVLTSSQLTAQAAHRAVLTNRLSDDYDAAAQVIAAQESLKDQYQLEPTPARRAAYARLSREFVLALRRVQQAGSASDGSTVESVFTGYARFGGGVARLFDAADDDNPTAVQIINEEQVGPAFVAVESLLVPAAQAANEQATGELAHLRRLETVNARLTPIVFLAGLLLTVIMALISGGHRRQLDAARARAVHDSLHDDLTGLPNRRLFTDRVDQALRAGQRSGLGLSVFLVDLDRFKEVNDTLGHRHGDELLIQAGQRMRNALRRSDTIARLGGDEFAVLLPDLTDPGHATDVAAKLTAELTRTFTVHGVDLDMEASIGVVVHTDDDGEDPDTVADATVLLQRADQAMYAAKSGNLGFVVHDPAADTRSSPATLTLLGELRRALENDQLLLHFQPKISIRTGDVVGLEALVRWQHPTQGLIFPDSFIPIAEHTGLIGPLTRRVLDLAARAAAHWAATGHALPVAVNLSARNLTEDQLPQQISDLLAQHRLPAGLLHLEVTESAISLDSARSTRILQDLSALGLRISVDDFGAGYTSLAQLRDLPIDELKIDRSFVMTMLENPANAHIVAGVVELGHNLGLTIVAEGVETHDILATLAGMHCDIAQGYLISRPLTPDDLAAWLFTHRSRPADQLMTPGP